MQLSDRESLLLNSGGARPTLGGVTRVRQPLCVLSAVVAAFGLAACGSGTKTLAAPAISVRVGALVLTVPRSFNRLTRRDGRLFGLVVTDYRVRADSPTLTRGVFPGNRVALVLERWRGPQVPAPPLRLPLSLHELEGPQHHATGTAWNGTLRLDGSLYTLSFWAGRTASPNDRAALLHALTSIRRAR
jgi:hypothetical protein